MLGPAALPGRLYAIAVSPDGKLLACGGQGYLRLFELTTGRLSKVLHVGGGAAVKSAVFSHDGRYLFTGGGGGRLNLTLWNVASGSPTRSSDAYSSTIATDQPKDLAVVGQDGDMRLLAAEHPYAGDHRVLARLNDFGWPSRERATRSGAAGMAGTPPTTQASTAEQLTAAERLRLFLANYAAVNRLRVMVESGVEPPAQMTASFLWSVRDSRQAPYIVHFYRQALAKCGDPQEAEYLRACLRAVAGEAVAALKPSWAEAALPDGDFAPGRAFFRTVFTAPQKAKGDFAELWLDAGAHPVVYLNGTQIYPAAGASTSLGAVSVDATRFVRAGRNVLAVQAVNGKGTEMKGLRLRLDVIPEKFPNVYVPEPRRWRCSMVEQRGWQETDFDDSMWHAAAVDPALLGAEPSGPSPVPGRVQAEAFDAGGEGLGYHDTGDTEVTRPVPYRQGAVGIDECIDEGGGFNVGGIKPGEWLAYTLEVKEAGTYDLDLRLSGSPAGSGGVLHVEIDGKDVTGPVHVPDTRSWQKWRTVTLPGLRLVPGRRAMRIGFDEAGADGEYVCNFNWFELRSSSEGDTTGSATTRPFAAATDNPRASPLAHEPTSPASVPARIQAEAFDPGGEGFGYHDNEREQIGHYAGRYRLGGVDLSPCSDEGGGVHVEYICPGEWLAYTLEVAETGEYELDLRLSGLARGASLHVEFDGKDVTGPVAVPDTSDWNAWRTVGAARLRLEKGRRVMRICFDKSDSLTRYVCNFNWFELRKHQVAAETLPAPLEK